MKNLFLFLFFLQLSHLQAETIILQARNREIAVNGKKAQVYEISQLSGSQGLSLNKGETFDVVVENKLDVPTGIHWHGLILPNNQDGVPFVTQPPILPGGKYPYHFPIVQAGTFWMHAHYGLQEQLLLAAPLILQEPASEKGKEVVLFLSDFTFQNPYSLFENLKNRKPGIMSKMSDDLNDVNYDAFLANWRTLSDPEVVEIQLGDTILLRVINGSASTNFFIQLGMLEGVAVAIDGSPIVPLKGNRFNVGVGQRIDIAINILENGFFPLLAQGEGLEMQTGIILKTKGVDIPTFSEKQKQAAKAITYAQEFQLEAKNGLPKKKIDRKVVVNLGGNMEKYIWTINGKAWPDNEPLFVKEGERVEMLFVNQTSMAHPMHLHGHVFQVTSLNGIELEGAMRDTMLVLPHSTVKVQFDAVHPGIWPLHCHNLYHQFAGMMTTLNYEGFKGPEFSKAEIMKEFQKSGD